MPRDTPRRQKTRAPFSFVQLSNPVAVVQLNQGCPPLLVHPQTAPVGGKGTISLLIPLWYLSKEKKIEIGHFSSYSCCEVSPDNTADLRNNISVANK